MGLARYTFRVRVSVAAECALLAEWGRCRWVWNQCVAESRQARKDGRGCGPAGLDKMLTGWRAERAYPLELFVPAATTLRGGPRHCAYVDEIVLALSAYRVPVEVLAIGDVAVA